MTRYFYSFIAIFFFVLAANAQNVGIGTSTPKKLLHLKGDDEVLKIQGNQPWIGFTNNTADSNDYNGFVYYPDTSLVLGTRFFTNMPVILAPNNIGLLYATGYGAVGIGTATPLAKLDVNGGARLSGTNTLELGGGVAGKEMNAGKIGYAAFTAGTLDIVGAGSNTTDRKVKLYAEAGTTLTGPINIGGALQVHSNSGTAGQVLTSTGTGAPQWKASAYSDNIKFAFSLSNASFVSTLMNVDETVYNLSPADITVGTNSFTINRSGLYHFNGNLSCGMVITNTAAKPEVSFNLVFSGGITYTHQLTANKAVLPRFLTNVYYMMEQFSQDFYIQAPTTIQVNAVPVSNASPVVSANEYMSIYGYRISD